MKILHVTRSISRDEGGPARSVQGLVAAQIRAGEDVWLLALRKGPRPWVEGIENFSDTEEFEKVAFRFKPDIVHIHGLWDLDEHRCVLICRRWKIPYVISPRGMLEPWPLKQKWIKKRIARFLYQDKDLKCALALHATAESEAEQFRKLGFRNPVVISPNGVNVPGNFNRVERVDGERKRVLFVSRMHPKKGVLELVEAWGRLGVECSGRCRDVGVEENEKELGVRNWVVELVYTLNGEFEREYEAKVKARILELGMSYQDTDGKITTPTTTPTSTATPHFIFTGSLNDDAKWDAYHRADIFVLPTYSENFGIVVAEALWAGVPVITTKGAPWSELETNKCGWWIDIGVDPLIAALSDATSLSDNERFEMGKRGRKLIEEKYTWDSAAEKMIEGYKEVLNGRN